MSSKIALTRQANQKVILELASRFALIWLGLFALVAALHFGRFFLAPIFLAVVTGLMLMPICERLERVGWGRGPSAMFTVIILLVVIISILIALAVPLSTWAERIPLIWYRITALLEGWQKAIVEDSNFKQIIADLSVVPNDNEGVIDQGETVKQALTIAPGLVGQILLFFATLYFFLASWIELRASTLRLCMSKKMRIRSARVFRDVEVNVSRYMLQISLINVGLGIAVGLAMWALGLPSPVLWGILAALLNYVIYLGPAVMSGILIIVGIATGGDTLDIIAPALAFIALNITEAYFVTPQVLGRSLTINPFAVFLTLAFWIWIWGPIGGFVAVPSLLIIYVALRNILGVKIPRQQFARIVRRSI